MYTELCISKLNSKERRKFSLELLAEALEDIDQEEIESEKTIMAPSIKRIIRNHLHNYIQKEVKKQT